MVLYLAAQYWVFSAKSLKREKKLPGEVDRPVVPGQPRLYTYEVRRLRAHKTCDIARFNHRTRLMPTAPTAETLLLCRHQVVAEHDHDPGAFTQGLLCKEGSAAGEERCSQFWESTGLYGETSVRVVDRKTGKVIQEQSAIDEKHFGEGLIEYDDEILMLTWRTNQGLAFDKHTLEQTRSFQTPMKDGWVR